MRRNVATLVDTPSGKRRGRPSKSLTLEQAEAVLRAAKGSNLEAYVVLSLMTGARTEEIRALRWADVDLDGEPDSNPPVPPHVDVWRSVRAHGDTKTEKSRRTSPCHRSRLMPSELTNEFDWRPLASPGAVRVGTTTFSRHARDRRWIRRTSGATFVPC